MKLYALDLPWKLLVTTFLIVLSSGFVVSELYLKHTTEMADGKEGLSMDDITLTFFGSPTPKLSQQVEGPMMKYFAEGGDEKDLTADDKADIKAVVDWVKAGAKEEAYWDKELGTKTKDKKSVFKILDNHGCYDCHSPEATMKGNKKDSPLDSYANISKFTKANTGIDKGRLLSLSHIHLLGMGMMFLLAGAAVACTIWPVWIRCALILGGLSSVLLDIFGWWGVKYGGPGLSPLVMLSGMLMAACFGASVFVSLFDLWLRRPPATPAHMSPLSPPSGSAAVIMADSRQS